MNLYASVAQVKVTSAISTITEESLMNSLFYMIKNPHFVSWGISWTINIFKYPWTESLQQTQVSDAQIKDYTLHVAEHMSHGLPYRVCTLYWVLRLRVKCVGVLLLSWPLAVHLPASLHGFACCFIWWFKIYIPGTERDGNKRRRGNIARIPPPVVKQTLIPLMPQWQFLPTTVCTLLEYFT